MFSDMQFSGWMDRKYDAIATQAGAAADHGTADLIRSGGQNALSRAQAGKTGLEAEEVKADHASEREYKKKLGDKALAEGAYSGAQAGEVAANAAAARGLQGAQSDYYGAHAGQLRQSLTAPGGGSTAIQPSSPAPMEGMVPDGYGGWTFAWAHGTASVPHLPATHEQRVAFHGKLMAQHGELMAKGGVTRVPGKGPSTVDTVPAILAPREAVLNEHAADLIGRDKIAAANAIGVAHQKAQAGKGMVGAPKGRKHFAEGTADVPGRTMSLHEFETSGSPAAVAQGWPAKAPGRDMEAARNDALGQAQQRYATGAQTADPFSPTFRAPAYGPSPGGMVADDRGRIGGSSASEADLPSPRATPMGGAPFNPPSAPHVAAAPPLMAQEAVAPVSMAVGATPAVSPFVTGGSAFSGDVQPTSLYARNAGALGPSSFTGSSSQEMQEPPAAPKYVNRHPNTVQILGNLGDKWQVWDVNSHEARLSFSGPKYSVFPPHKSEYEGWPDERAPSKLGPNQIAVDGVPVDPNGPRMQWDPRTGDYAPVDTPPAATQPRPGKGMAGAPRRRHYAEGSSDVGGGGGSLAGQAAAAGVQMSGTGNPGSSLPPGTYAELGDKDEFLGRSRWGYAGGTTSVPADPNPIHWERQGNVLSPMPAYPRTGAGSSGYDLKGGTATPGNYGPDGSTNDYFGERKPQKLAKGSHNVQPGKSEKTPSKIDPQALLSLMQAMHGGSEQPAPGGGTGGLPPRKMGGMVAGQAPQQRFAEGTQNVQPRRMPTGGLVDDKAAAFYAARPADFEKFLGGAYSVKTGTGNVGLRLTNDAARTMAPVLGQLPAGHEVIPDFEPGYTLVRRMPAVF